MPRFDTLNEHFIDDDGSLLIAGMVFFFDAGTTDEKDTFKDPALTIANTNPIILTGDGKWPFQVWFDGTAQVILQDSQGQQIENTSPLGGVVTTDAFADYNNQIAYSANDIVIASDTRYYSSISGNNINNDPTSTSGFWMEIWFLNDFELSKTYMERQFVTASDNNLYASLIDNNLGNDPISSPTEWGVRTSNFPGINDIATGVRLEIADTSFRIGTAGADYHIHHVEDDQSIEYLGGRSDANASGYRTFGHLHATQANDGEFLADGSVHTAFDFSTTTWDYGSNTITTTGPLNCGALTSTGIDDNATGKRLQLEDAVLSLGTTATDYVLKMSPNDRIFTISGGNTSSSGATLQMFGGTHTAANDLKFRAGATPTLTYNDTQSKWDFQANDVLTSWNFVPASGSGIDFSATADGSGTTTSELLDDYEEGTFAPVVSDGTNNATLSVALGFYTKIGNRVYYSGRVVLTSKGSMSGDIRITGLPFVSENVTNARSSVLFSSATSMSITAGQSLSGRITNNQSLIFCQIWNSTTGTTNLVDTELTNGSDFSFSGSYPV